MLIERTDTEVIIRLPSYMDTEGLQSFIDYLSYKEATAKSRASQADVDKLVKQIKKSRREVIKERFAKIESRK